MDTKIVFQYSLMKNKKKWLNSTVQENYQFTIYHTVLTILNNADISILYIQIYFSI